MEKHNFLRKLLALTLATTMTLAMGLSASAASGDLLNEDLSEGGGVSSLTKYVDGTDGLYEDDDDILGISFSKTLVVDDDVVPSVYFYYVVSLGSDVTLVANSDGDVVKVKGGVEDGLIAGDASIISFGLADEADEYGNVEKSGYLIVDCSVFEEAGVYHYVVSEYTSGNVSGQYLYEYITYDETVYDVYVWVLTNDDGDLYVAYVQALKRSDVSTPNVSAVSNKNNLSWSNDYDTAALKIKKIISGDLADSSATWTFTITISNCYYGQVLYYLNGEDRVYLDVVKDESEGVVYDDNGCVSYTVSIEGVGDESEIEIYGLMSGNTFKITESEGTDSGYTATYTVTGDDITNVTNENTTDYTVTGTLEDGKNEAADDGETEDVNVEITNTKDNVTPTGVIINYLPYFLLIMIAGAIMILFFRRRRADY